MGIRFGLDIGIASVGWAVVNDEYEVLEAGSNIFSSAEAAQNVDRRSFRQLRRLHRRKKVRSKDFIKLWKEYGFSIPNNSYVDVLDLRVKGLEKKLSEKELFSVLKYYLQHRGISYLDEIEDEGKTSGSDYAKGIELNRKNLQEMEYPCRVQLKRFEKYGRYRGDFSVDIDGEKVILSNVFTTGAYTKELKRLLEIQQSFHENLTDDFVKKYLLIFGRKREYYVGPGNEKSRTDYGIYTTRFNELTGEYFTEENIFEKLIGKCSVYPEEMRAAGASYTAQEFNVLNDLNTLTVNDRKLSKEEKEEIIREIQSCKSVNMRNIIKKVMGEEIVTLTGARVDKSDKEIFHHFEQYNLFRKEFEKNDWDINELTREDLDQIGNILTLNTGRDAIYTAFKKAGLGLSDEKREVFVTLRKKNGSLFNKWQSFSLKIMNELIPEMYMQPKNQMQLLTDMKYFKPDKEKFAGLNKIPKDMVTENIYNPVVRRSIRITVDIVNALVKKYGNPSEIIIEMPRDRNSDDEKKRLNEEQKNREKELSGIIKKIKDEYGIEIKDENFRQQNKLALKLKLWNEQDGVCVYSGKPISIDDLLHNPNLFEVDHIIPKSISYDDSRTNKVLVYRTENQKKGNQTPYLYLEGIARDWDFDEYMNYVINLKSKKLISKAKLDKLLFKEDITKIEVLKGFISRNINDTRYASKVVLNAFQSYFEAKDMETKIKVVRGSFTGQIRNAMHLDKNRDESYSHHAVDAMLICYSQMGFEAYHKLQEEFIDFETNEIKNQELWDENMVDQKYEEVIYQGKWVKIRANIQAAEKKVKFWHKRDTKANRALSDQTIRGTRNIDGKIQKINKLDIYTKNGYETLKNKLSKGKEGDFLMYRHDRRTWDDMLQIMEDYRDAQNPFAQYELETGDYLRKYSKKHDGARIIKLKYLDGEVGSCIDISHKYGHEKNSRKVLLESLKPYRADVYYQQNTGEYRIIGVKYADLKFNEGRYIIDLEAYERILQEEKILKKENTINDLEALGFQYQFSLYKNDIIEYELNGEFYIERFLSRTKPKSKNYIETKPIDAPKFEKRHQIGLGKTKSIRKIRLDILGNRYYCDKEKFTLEVDNV